MKHFFFFITLSILLAACQEKKYKHSSIEKESASSMEGKWLGHLHISAEESIAFNFSINSTEDSLTIINGSERIPAPISKDSGSLIVSMPYFDSEFKLIYHNNKQKLAGFWYNKAKGEDYKILFSAKVQSNEKCRFFEHRPNTNSKKDLFNFSGKWETTFEINTDNQYMALGLFEQDAETITGTFLTETGDYRYLQGNVKEDSMRISCFDGSHAFLFSAKMNGDSLSGKFYSGNHYSDSWIAHKNENFTLQNPDSLTYL